MNYQHILDRLPYKSSFRFVDDVTELGPDKVIGHYTLKADSFFYHDHFPGNPVTPGAILSEIMAQIGLVVLGIYLVTKEPEKVSSEREKMTKEPGKVVVDDKEPVVPVFPLLTSANVEFLKMVLPGQKVIVISNKVYFRFDKLKCNVVMQDEAGEAIAKGVFAGMIKQLHK